MIHFAVQQKLTQHCKETTSIKYSKGRIHGGLQLKPGRKIYKCSTATVSGLSTPTTAVSAKDVFRSWTITAHADGGESDFCGLYCIYNADLGVYADPLWAPEDHLLPLSPAFECTGQKYSDFSPPNNNPVDIPVP